MYYMNHVTKFFFFTDQHFLLVVPLNPKMNRGSTGSGLTTAKRGKNQQAGKFLETQTYNPNGGNLQLLA